MQRLFRAIIEVALMHALKCADTWKENFEDTFPVPSKVATKVLRNCSVLFNSRKVVFLTQESKRVKLA